MSASDNRQTNTNDLDLDSLDFDNMDGLFADMADVAVEGGFDSDNHQDDCAGGACKI